MASTRKEIETYLPLGEHRYEVIVAGGGPAGLAAAVAAAKGGAKTLLLEGRAFLGGVGALALWMPINRLFTDGKSRGGVHDSFVRAIRDFGPEGAVEGRNCFTDGEGLDTHPECLRLATFRLLEDAGCRYRLYSPVTGVKMDKGRITGVEVSGKTGPELFEADVVIDATGDGDVAYYAGAEMMEGREEDGMHMPVSLIFAVSGVDEERFFAYFNDNEKTEKPFSRIIEDARAKGLATAVWYSFDKTTLPGVLSVNNGGVYGIGNVDGKDAAELTLVERLGIEVAHDFIRIAREAKIPGMENVRLARAGAGAAVRDTRRVVGDYVVTVEDARTGPDFPDIVARKYGAIDANQLFIGEMKSGYGYPYRSMLPKGIEGLLVAGRCGSATFLGHAAGKSMGNMMALGEAAGVAAAIAVKKGLTPRAVDVSDVQKKLREMGVAL